MATIEENMLIPVKNLVPEDVFKEGGTEPIIDAIKIKVEEFEPDISTAKGRAEIKSFAFKVTKSKTFLLGLGDSVAEKYKKIIAEHRAILQPISSEQKRLADELDNLAKKARNPLTEWEAEQARIKAEKEAREQFEKDWEAAIHDNEIFDRERELARREAELKRQEEERQAKEEADRLERERIANEERLKKEAAEQAKREAEQKAEQEKQEAIRKQIEAEQAARNAQIQKELAERKAKADAEEAEKKRLADIKAAEEKAGGSRTPGKQAFPTRMVSSHPPMGKAYRLE